MDRIVNVGHSDVLESHVCGSRRTMSCAAGIVLDANVLCAVSHVCTIHPYVLDSIGTSRSFSRTAHRESMAAPAYYVFDGNILMM